MAQSLSGLSETHGLEQRDGAEAQGEEAGAQQVAQRRQVGDGEVVRVQAPPPHQADDEVGDVEEDGHLEGKGQLLLRAASVLPVHNNNYTGQWFITILLKPLLEC